MPVFDPAMGIEVRKMLYMERKKQFPNGHFIEFPFIVEDSCWSICVYPNGTSSSSKDYISIFLVLTSRIAEPVRARAKFSLFDWTGMEVPSQSVDTDLREFSVVDQGYGCHQFIQKEFLEASEHLANDCIRIMCDVTVYLTRPPRRLQHHLHDVVTATNVRFLVGGESYSAHKCVLTARSPAFAAMLFRGNTTTGENCIRIHGMAAQVFKALLHFLYTDYLPEMNEQEQSLVAESLLAAANRFELPKLKMICEEILSSDVNENTVAKMLDLANQHACQMLREACIEFLEEHPALDAVMATDDGSLLEHVAKSSPELLKDICADWFEDDFF